MSPELTVLALAGLLQGVQFMLMGVPLNLELGAGKITSPRDNDQMPKPLIDQVSKPTARLIRALNNHFEGLILFTIAVVTVVLGDKSTGFTEACAWTYLVARILYVPAYAFGFVPWRTIIWTVGFFATMAMIASTILF